MNYLKDLELENSVKYIKARIAEHVHLCGLVVALTLEMGIHTC